MSDLLKQLQEASVFKAPSKKETGSRREKAREMYSTDKILAKMVDGINAVPGLKVFGKGIVGTMFPHHLVFFTSPRGSGYFDVIKFLADDGYQIKITLGNYELDGSFDPMSSSPDIYKKAYQGMKKAKGIKTTDPEKLYGIMPTDYEEVKQ